MIRASILILLISMAACTSARQIGDPVIDSRVYQALKACERELLPELALACAQAVGARASLSVFEQAIAQRLAASYLLALGRENEAWHLCEQILSITNLPSGFEGRIRQDLARIQTGRAPIQLAQADDYTPRKPLPAIAYPAQAAADGIGGCVLTEFTIDESGKAVNARVIAAKPGGVFEKAALKNVSEFNYDPPNYKGDVVRVFSVRHLFTFVPARDQPSHCSLTDGAIKEPH